MYSTPGITNRSEYRVGREAARKLDPNAPPPPPGKRRMSSAERKRLASEAQAMHSRPQPPVYIGQWEAGVTRTLITCGAGTCPGAGIFGAGTLGKPGYGRIVRAGTTLQMSTFTQSAETGIADSRMQMDNFPLTRITTATATASG